MVCFRNYHIMKKRKVKGECENMGIQIADQVFHIQTKETSYIMMVNAAQQLCHVYYGKKVEAFSIGANWIRNEKNLDTLPSECAAFGTGDFRTPTFEITTEKGSTTSELRYVGYRLTNGKADLKGLPSTYVRESDEAETLEIELEDENTGLKVIVVYTVIPSYNIITRNIQYINLGTKNRCLLLRRAMSMCMDFDHDEFDLLQLSGSWGREKHIYKRGLVPGIQSIDSKRGISSAVQNPFVALMGKEATEEYGEVYGFNLVYSGNFLVEIEDAPFKKARITMGINPFDFTWNLEANQMFQTPEVVMVYSDAGLGKMSRTYHKFYRERLCRGTYQYKERPILINNWEATYFNFEESKIYDIAMAGKELGMELFVLDDGWFGYRDSDHSSLGDWVVDRKKLPNGLEHLVHRITEKGIRFGLWFEPEMVSPDSDLYRAHPDWCIHVPERMPKASPYQRNQLVLDLSRKEVCDYIIESVSSILASAPISYVKWDMNRPITDYGSARLALNQQREIAHRYMLGLYYVLEEVTGRFPEVLFESCSSGGGRFDPGMLYYMPQTWTSDDTDAVERLKIQYGTSMVYPAVSMGSHVSACPNHQVGRKVGLQMRGEVAMCGNFGYELDLTQFSDEEKEVVKKQVAQYKEIRQIVQFGEMYRLISPFERDGNETAWGFVSEDKSEAVFCYYHVLAYPNTLPSRIKLKGLAPDKVYRIDGMEQADGESYCVGGDELMHIGLERKNEFGDFKSWMIVLKEVK